MSSYARTSVLTRSSRGVAGGPRRAAEANSQLALQIRNRDLAAADDNARSLVVQVVLLELHSAASRLLLLGGDGVVEDRLALLAEEAGETRALLFGDVRSVEP